MKRMIVLLLALLPLFAMAQAQNEGEVIYKEKVKIDIDLPEEHEHLRSMLPETQRFKKQLLFTADKVLYKDVAVEEEEEDDMAQEGNVQIKVAVLSAENQVFTNLNTGEKVER